MPQGPYQNAKSNRMEGLPPPHHRRTDTPEATASYQ